MEPWSGKSLGLLGGAIGATYADTQTTKDFVGRGGEETNPLLSKKPSGQELDRAAALSGVLGTGIASLLSDQERQHLLGAWAGLESGLAYKNAHKNPTEKKSDLLHSGLEGPLTMMALGFALPKIVDGMSVSPTSDGGKGMKMTLKKDF